MYPNASSSLKPSNLPSGQASARSRPSRVPSSSAAKARLAQAMRASDRRIASGASENGFDCTATTNLYGAPWPARVSRLEYLVFGAAGLQSSAGSDEFEPRQTLGFWVSTTGPQIS